MEGCFGTGEGGAGPGVVAQMEGVLMTFGFVLIFETVRAVCASVLLFGLVDPRLG